MVENVILITIDSLRADHLSCYGYQKRTTPNLDELSKKGFLFTQAFSNGPWTPASFPSILTSSYSLQYPYSAHLSPQRIMLSEVLKREGYLTGGVHCCPYLSSFYGYNRGFETFRDFLFDNYGVQDKINELTKGHGNFTTKIGKKIKDVFGESSSIYRFLKVFHSEMYKIMNRDRSENFLDIVSKYAKAETINREVISWLENGVNGKFFLWIHYMDVHIPYTPRTEYMNQIGSPLPEEIRIRELNEKLFKYRGAYNKRVNMSEDELRLMIDLYDAELRHADEAIGSLLEEITRIGLLDNTLVIVTADHGDEFLEHGSVAHSPKLYDELLHVPLIFYAPEIDKGKIIDDLVSLLDLAPTIVDVLGIKKPEQWLGESLLPLIKGEQTRIDNGVISEVLAGSKRKTAYRTKKWKFILDEEKNAYELYDLENDRKEKNNVAEENPDIVNYLSLKINEHISMENKISREVEERKRIGENIKKLKTRGKI
jgi:arylsulfatase A-like enzyme